MISVPSDKHSVVSEDGRVFYDLAELIRHYDEIITVTERGAAILGQDQEYVAGQRWLLDKIQSAHDGLVLKGSLAETE